MTVTSSEKLFEEYLSKKGLVADKDFFYEPDLGKPKRPDYLVRINADTLFEIKEFSRESKADRYMRTPENFSVAIRLDPYSQTREKIGQARKKFKDYKNDYPCVLILHKGDSFTAGLDTQLIAGSAYGDISLRMSPDGSNSQWIFDKNGELSPKKNTTLSAIAVIEEIYPEKAVAGKEFWKEHEMPEMLGNDLLQVYEAWCKSKGYNIRKRYVRLRTIINPFAKKPISQDFFDQKYDEVSVIKVTGKFVRVK
ncbi:MAG: hypothetical protein ABSB00_03385 [Minisyncoccia bacterium]|jgi:hypothetical protein